MSKAQQHLDRSQKLDQKNKSKHGLAYSLETKKSVNLFSCCIEPGSRQFVTIVQRRVHLHVASQHQVAFAISLKKAKRQHLDSH